MELAFLRREAAWVFFIYEDEAAVRTRVYQDPHYFLSVVLVTALAVVTRFGSTPHHSNYGDGFSLRWVFSK